MNRVETIVRTRPGEFRVKLYHSGMRDSSKRVCEASTESIQIAFDEEEVRYHTGGRERHLPLNCYKNEGHFGLHFDPDWDLSWGLVEIAAEEGPSTVVETKIEIVYEGVD